MVTMENELGCVRWQELVSTSDVDRFLYKAPLHADEPNLVFSHAVSAKKAMVASFFILRNLYVY